MKNLFYSIALALFVAACGGPNTTTPEGKKQRLEELLKDQSRIAVEIAKLQSELANADKPATSKADKPKAVQVGAVSATTFKHFIDVQGQVTSNNVVTVNAKLPGTLEAVYVNMGDVVTKGQVLAKVDNAVVRANLQELDTRLAVAEDLYQRQKGLWDQKIGSEVQYINAKASRDGLKRTIATLNEQLNQTQIVAPISGTIDILNARVGETAQNPAGLFKIVNLSDLKITADVAEAYAPYLKIGAAVEVDFPELNETLSGKISFVSSTVNATSRTITVEARVANTSRLRPNMLAKVRVNDQTLANTISIDQNLVQTNENGDVVYVVTEKEGKPVAQSRAVKIGLSYNGRVQIVSGLQAGDRLITLGYLDVTDGQAISF
jgi:RND family efflux transporter MFP subunit